MTNLTLSRHSIHADVLRAVAPDGLTEQEALHWMVLFHTHVIHLRAGVDNTNGHSNPNGDIEVLPALTRRSCAEIIASIWPDSGDERSDYKYWYCKYSSETPIECAEEIPPVLLTCIRKLKERLAMDTRVLDVVPEND